LLADRTETQNVVVPPESGEISAFFSSLLDRKADLTRAAQELGVVPNPDMPLATLMMIGGL
jgi:hypothetical protein